MTNDIVDTNDLDENERACLELHYWPALERFQKAIDNYTIELNINGPLDSDHPLIVELNEAHNIWAEELRHWDFVKKMCMDHDGPQ